MRKIIGTLSWNARVVILGVALAAPALADHFSFQGTFVNDNDVQLFNFILSADTNVTLQTWGYGGGVNANGDTISPGGFVPVLQIFDAPSGLAHGGLIPPGVFPACFPRNVDPGRPNSCQDDFAQIFLTAGSYYLSLTQSDNNPLGNLSDGFFWVDTIPDPNFNNGFNTILGQGTGAWALDIVDVQSAAQVPEPGSALLAATAVLLAGIGARRRRRRSSE